MADPKKLPTISLDKLAEYGPSYVPCKACGLLHTSASVHVQCLERTIEQLRTKVIQDPRIVENDERLSKNDSGIILDASEYKEFLAWKARREEIRNMPFTAHEMQQNITHATRFGKRR